MAEPEAITPELVLVDPELRRRLLDQAMLEILHETLYPTHPEHAAVRRPPWRPSGSAAGRPKSLRQRTALAAEIAIMVTVATLVIVLPSLAFLPPRQRPTLPHKTLSPAPSAQIVWNTDPAADYYLVEFLVGGRLVAVRTPSEPTLSIPPSAASDGAAWRVFAGYGPVAAHNTSGPIASGSIPPARRHVSS
jgi:hypothetical protein